MRLHGEPAARRGCLARAHPQGAGHCRGGNEFKGHSHEQDKRDERIEQKHTAQ